MNFRLLTTFSMILVFALSLGASMEAIAAQDTSKLGVVDFQRALNSVEQGKIAKAKLKKEFDQKQKKIDQEKKAIEKLQKELQALQTKAQSGLLKEAEMKKGRAKEQDFQKRMQNYTRLVQESQAEIGKREGEATREILDRLRDMVVDLARQEGYSMVLEKNESGLIYASTFTDLTEKLIQKYNKKHKK